MRDTVIRTVNGVPIRVADLAEVSLDRRDIGRFVEINETPMLRLGIRKQSGANTVAVAQEIRREAERPDINMIVIQDQSQFIQQSIDSVRNSALWGGLLTVIVLMAFFRNGSITMVVAWWWSWVLWCCWLHRCLARATCPTN